MWSFNSRRAVLLNCSMNMFVSGVPSARRVRLNWKNMTLDWSVLLLPVHP